MKKLLIIALSIGMLASNVPLQANTKAKKAWAITKIVTGIAGIPVSLYTGILARKYNLTLKKSQKDFSSSSLYKDIDQQNSVASEIHRKLYRNNLMSSFLLLPLSLAAIHSGISDLQSK